MFTPFVEAAGLSRMPAASSELRCKRLLSATASICKGLGFRIYRGSCRVIKTLHRFRYRSSSCALSWARAFVSVFGSLAMAQVRYLCRSCLWQLSASIPELPLANKWLRIV